MTSQKRILIVDDDPEQCLVVAQALRAEGYTCAIAYDGLQAIRLSRQQPFDLYLLDIRMQPLDGIQVLEEIRGLWAEAQVIILSAFGDVDVAVKCMKLGAYDFVTKPIDFAEMKLTVANALKASELSREVTVLRNQLEIRHSPDFLFGESPAMQELLRTLEQIARHQLTVMIRGESGTGKELTARALHTLSPRAAAPFISVDCATLPETLVESELFGYERGAFTGAVVQKIGRFEQAGEGTLFLDEIGNLPLSIQMKLLRVLQERRFSRLGGKEEHAFRATLVSATNQDLEQSIREGRFREDLYYRLNEFMLRIPPLRERPEDIPLLVKHFLDVFNRQFDKRIQNVTEDALALFLRYPWPGNVRELKNVVKRGLVLADLFIERQHLPEALTSWAETPALASEDRAETEAPLNGMSLKEIVKRAISEIEKRVIQETLSATRWNRTVAAKQLDIDYKTLYNKIKEYEID